ncbi:metal ABC transporter ATP-binding protein [Terribacillus sp. DMT04]|uniref:metal ABC transporter ATP-binding protein n=1 Tax=Terribacillus sp. DMT04 TaxID=2850441 RepID=UPI001C2C640C|nr:metal ABC transporter ATP-binding protein [Terribacillus sp. DMT04]QXE00825.1 metal ABC transporter ATP-binding protein [Terribacillus sp. DMT04]
MESILHINSINFSYENKAALRDVSLDVKSGDFLGLIGPNGGGKTTLIKLALGLLQPNKGDIELFGESVSSFKDWNKVSFVSQKASSFNKAFPATVFEVVAMGLTPKIGYFKRFTAKHRAAVKQAVAQVDMSDYLHQNISSLSGGQQQRVFIARALVSQPELIILDEPTVGIDHANVKGFYELLHRLNKETGLTLVMITHDLAGIAQHASKLVYLDQQVQYEGEPEHFTLPETDFQVLRGIRA